MSDLSNNQSNTRRGGHNYLISLNKWRSIIALIAGLMAFILSFMGELLGMIHQIVVDLGPGYEFFHFFTFQSNALNTLAAGVLIPFAVEGIRKRRFVCPRWVSLLQCSAVECVLIVMIFTLTCISWYDPEKAFGGGNTFMHVISPIMIFITFLMVDTPHRFSVKNVLLCLIPFFVYALEYLLGVFILGKGNHGWKDYYHLKDLVPLWVSIPGMLILGVAVALLMRLVNNKLVPLCHQRLSSCWSEEKDPVEVRVEVFGLGRFYGLRCESESVDMPMDVLKELSERFRIPIADLLRSFTGGVLHGQADRERYLCSKQH